MEYLGGILNLDLIKKFLPNSKVINCKRNPLSSIMSILKISKDNADDDMVNAIIEAFSIMDDVNTLEDFKYSSGDSDPPNYKITDLLYKLLAQLFTSSKCFTSKDSIFKLIDCIEIESDKNEANQTIDDLYEEFITLQSSLKIIMNNTIINYHKTELRRLTNGKTDINIENLNI